MTDRSDLLEAFTAAFRDAFGGRAMGLAESQREHAVGVARERWQQIIELITAPALPQV